MKKSTIITLFFPLLSFCQDTALSHIFPMKDGSVYYEKIFTIDSASKEELFSRARSWAVSNKSQINSEYIEDNGSGAISFNVSFSEFMILPKQPLIEQMKTEWQYWGTFKMYVKDGKAKITVDNIRFSGLAATNLYKIEMYRPMIESMYPGNKRIMNNFINASYKSFQLADDAFNKLIASASSSLSDRSNNDF